MPVSSSEPKKFEEKKLPSPKCHVRPDYIVNAKINRLIRKNKQFQKEFDPIVENKESFF